MLTNSSGPGSLLIYSSIFRLLEMLFDQPQSTDAELMAISAAIDEARLNMLDQIGEIDIATVTPYLESYLNADLGNLTVRLRDDKLIFDVGEFHSELRPQLGESGEVTGYLFVDEPMATFAPPMIVTLPEPEGDTYLPI